MKRGIVLSSKKLNVAIIGMGGFAGTHHQTMLRLEASGASKLIATCDPKPEIFADKIQALGFEKRGIKFFTDYKEMLKVCGKEIDVLVIPTPIPLHAEMHQAGVEAGIPIYLEKPPTLDPLELERMIETDKKASKKTFVAFNFIVEPQRQKVKERLLSGEFGKIKTGQLMAFWARPKSYYERANWAGRLELNGQLILDSPLGNAMAHQVHNLFFWLGELELFHWSEIKELTAECFRAHSIQGTDTAFVAGLTNNETPFQIVMSHAVDGPHRQWEKIICEKATITWILREKCVIAWNDGRQEEIVVDKAELLDENHKKYYEYVQGNYPRPMTTLLDSKPFVLLNNLLYVSSQKINRIPKSEIRNSTTEKNGVTEHWTHWLELEKSAHLFFTTGVFPSKDKTWITPGSSVLPKDVDQLAGVIQTMCAQL